MIITDKPHPRKELTGDKWRSCVLCGNYYKRVELRFDSGSTLPVTDEVLTGATSADTMIVTAVRLVSGTWVGGDAVGIVEGKSMTGRDFDSRSFFQDNENINGSTGGANILTANGTGSEKIYGRLYPELQMILFRGKWYCNKHYSFRWKHRLIDEEHLDIRDDERGQTY